MAARRRRPRSARQDPRPCMSELWSDAAGWWQQGFTDGADPEYEEQILPLARHHLVGASRVLDVGAGEGQVTRLADQFAVGIDLTWNQLVVASARGGMYAQAAAGALPFATAAFDCV